MTDDRTLERAARSWLEEGPTQAPDRAVDAALSRIESTRQERDLRIPWRLPTMFNNRLVAAAIALVLIVGGGAIVLTRNTGIGGPTGAPTTSPATAAPTAAATASPTVAPKPTVAPTLRPTLSPLTFTQSYTSPIYHYAAKYPATWTLTAGTAENERDFIPDVGAGMSDFVGDQVASGVMVTSGLVSAGHGELASWTSFITTTIRGQYGNYIDLPKCVQSTRTLTLDGGPANEVDFICPAHDWLWVTAIHGGRAYQIAWLDDGGFTAGYLRPFLDQFLQDFTFTK